jgi:DNA-binding NtrC family response regulator
MQAESDIAAKVRPLLEEAMHRHLGVHVSEIETDISDLLRSPLLGFLIDTATSYRHAKSAFQRFYLLRALRRSQGNISEAAVLLGISRRTLHRLLTRHAIHAADRREARAPYARLTEVQGVIERALTAYRPALNPERFESLYRNAPELSKDIIRELPERMAPLDEAEREFERQYFSQLLKDAPTVVAAARKAGIRYETLFRKLKSLGLRHHAS